jgi:hypothetical protein
VTPPTITRRHVNGDTVSTAVYSTCEMYRYALTRTWGDAPPFVCVMLNPSTATESANDPTIQRCETRARQASFGGLRIANLYGFRATDPRDLKHSTDPVGPDNDAVLLDQIAGAGAVLAGWGIHGAWRGRGAQVAALLRDSGAPLVTLGLTKDGHPRHPLYVGYAQKFREWHHD